MNTLPRFLVLAAPALLLLGATQCRRHESPAIKAPEAQPVTETSKPPELPGFALIPSGEFMMGDALGDINGDGPQHKVNVSAFYMQKTEVSKAQWDEVRVWALKHGYADLPEGKGKAGDHPVREVTWYSVVKWCNARSEKEGLVPSYYTDAAQVEIYRKDEKDLANTMVKWSGTGYRLPTEAEWEKAARGGLSGKRFPWGDTISHNDANFCNDGDEAYAEGSTGYHPTGTTGDNHCTSPVGSFAVNGYGIHDMAGNVWEWCWDGYGDYSVSLEADPRGAAERSFRVVRGGGWYGNANDCRVAFRSFAPPRPIPAWATGSGWPAVRSHDVASMPSFMPQTPTTHHLPNKTQPASRRVHQVLMTDHNSKPAPASTGESAPAYDAGHVAMKARRKFSPVRVMLAAQVASVGLAFWFMFYSTSMSCAASCSMGSIICLIQSVNSGLLVVALVIERKWLLLVLPLAFWFVVCMIVFVSVH